LENARNMQNILSEQIARQLGFTMTGDQTRAVETFCRFMQWRDDRTAMILTGSAGTGKTSIAAAIVRSLILLRQKVVLLAPTGRAAKVFIQNVTDTDHVQKDTDNMPDAVRESMRKRLLSVKSSTIHRKIYRQRTFNGPDGQFNLNDNLHSDTLFVVDEASMIANQGFSDAAFGSGRLLDDLMHYVYAGKNCRLMLIGDTAQLPPVGEDESPALNKMMIEGYGLTVFNANLAEVVRQSEESGILWNANQIRQMITRDEQTQLPKIRFKDFADIRIVPGDELIESMAASYSEVGIDETMVITRSNKRANIYNLGIRNTVLGREEMLSSGDILMIVKNKYLKQSTETARSSSENSNDEAQHEISFLANGDRAIVRRVRNVRELYGFTFADLLISLPDYDDQELLITVITDCLMAEAPALTQEQNKKLYESILEDYADVTLKAERMKLMREDIYYNAVQIKYGYAITCHKAQGGQWAHVYLDQGYMTDEMLNADYIHWLYTAFTRAKERLFLVNWPKNQVETDTF